MLDKAGGGPFSFDDVEVVTLLGAVVGAALVDAIGAPVELPPPARLVAELTAMAESDPEEYARIGPIVASLLRRS